MEGQTVACWLAEERRGPSLVLLRDGYTESYYSIARSAHGERTIWFFYDYRSGHDSGEPIRKGAAFIDVRARHGTYWDTKGGLGEMRLEGSTPELFVSYDDACKSKAFTRM